LIARCGLALRQKGVSHEPAHESGEIDGGDPFVDRPGGSSSLLDRTHL